MAPRDPEGHYNLGLALRLNGEVEEAERAFRQALEIKPDHALARRALGLVLRRKGDLEGAASELRLAVADLPQDSMAHHNLGSVQLKLGRADQAVHELREAIRLDPYLLEAYYNLVRALRKAGQAEEAARVTDRAEQLSTEKAHAGRSIVLLQSALQHKESGDLEAALDELREATTLSPQLLEAQFQLALTLRELHQETPETEQALRRVLELQPGHARAHHQLGRLLQQLGKTEEAVTELRAATRLAPSLIEAHRALGRQSLGLEQWALAAAEFRAVLAWHPDDLEAQKDLATALEALGEVEKSF